MASLKNKILIQVTKMSHSKTFLMSMRQISKLQRMGPIESRQMRQRSINQALKSAIFHVETSEDFQNKVLNSDKPVVVDFFASWCSPCKALAPRLENIIKEQAGEIRLAKVDIDENSDLALNYDVASVPSMLVMRNGRVVNRLVGLQESGTIRDWIEDSVSAHPKRNNRTK